MFFFNDTATTEIYTLSLHDALPIYPAPRRRGRPRRRRRRAATGPSPRRSEEHTSELQSPCNVVCRLLLEKTTNSADTPPIPPADSVRSPAYSYFHPYEFYRAVGHAM